MINEVRLIVKMMVSLNSNGDVTESLDSHFLTIYVGNL